MAKITDYPAKTVFNDTDLIDFSTDNGGGSFTSEKSTWLQMRQQIGVFTPPDFYNILLADIIGSFNFTGTPLADITVTLMGSPTSRVDYVNAAGWSHMWGLIGLNINNTGSSAPAGSYIAIDVSETGASAGGGAQAYFSLQEHSTGGSVLPNGNFAGGGTLGGTSLLVSPNGGIPSGSYSYLFSFQSKFFNS